MAGEIDNYLNDEEEFLRDHWEGSDKAQVLQEIRGWIHWQLIPVASAVTHIFREIGDRFSGHTVKALRDDWIGYDDRFVVSLDTSNATKTPEKILEKLVREWRDKNKPLAPKTNRLNYQTELVDVLRFRYVVNFLEDGKKLNRFLLREAGKPKSRLIAIAKNNFAS